VQRRPGGVTFAGWLMGINGAFSARVFAGGCVRYDNRFASGVPASLSLQADDAFSFVARPEVVAAVRDGFNQTLCGVDAPPCEDPG
jgi:hypothetical protein